MANRPADPEEAAAFLMAQMVSSAWSVTINPTANAPLLASHIPGADLYLVNGGRHGYFLEFREEASAVVLDFLGRHPL